MTRLIGFVWFLLLALPAVAGDYTVTHLDKSKVFVGTTLLADMSNPKSPKVVEIDFEGNILWEFRPPRNMRGAILDAAMLDNGNILITVHPSGIYEISRSKKVVWAHRDPEASHDADRLPNGNTLYNLGWRKKVKMLYERLIGPAELYGHGKGFLMIGNRLQVLSLKVGCM